jgi:hypothetical protein
MRRKRMKTHLFFEVKDRDGQGMWGGEDEIDAIRFLKEHPGSTLWVSEWTGEGEELWQTAKALDITSVIGAVHYARVIPRIPV